MGQGASLPPGRRWPRIVSIGVAVAVILPAALAAAGWAWLASSLPPDSETLRTPAVRAAVSVRRDRFGVPYIRAESLDDAAFALGYVHAQDRLWQMETMRRLGTGRLSEVFGARTLQIDTYMRALGLTALVRQQAEALPPRLAAVFDAYARGVNHWMDHRTGALPPEFVILRHTPEAWSTADSLLWLKLIAVQLAQNRRVDALRLALKDRLSDNQLRDLWPLSDVNDGRSDRDDLAPADASGSDLALGGEVSAMPTWPTVAGASNAWIVGAEASATGKPILANDLHLPLSAPIQWYLARVDTPDGTLAGATAPGFPLLTLGHNGHVAWGMTSGEVDIEDLFVERLDPDGSSYATPSGPQPLTSRQETIGVRGEDDRIITVRETRHGPILNDPLQGDLDIADLFDGDATLKAVALRATYLADGDPTPIAHYRLNLARDVDGVLRAAPLFRTPPVNIFVADTEGDAAEMLVGSIPRRRQGGRLLPAPGWTDKGDWIGTVDITARRLEDGGDRTFIYNANNRPQYIDGENYIGDSWVTSMRAARLRAMLSEGPPATLNGTQALQMDVVSLAARRLVARLIGMLAPDKAHTATRRTLSAWSGTMDRQRPEPLIFVAWLRALDRRVFADELGDLFRWVWMFRPDRLERVLETRPEWCDDVTTDASETCAEQVRAALDDALAELTAAHGADRNAWRWGDAHVARFSHPVFDSIPLVNRLIGLSVETDGGSDTINRGGIPYGDVAAPFDHIHGPGIRAVYDLGDLSRSRFVIATGQSGNPLSKHYRDMLALWRDGGWIRLDRTMAEVECDGGGRIDIVSGK